MFSKYYPKVVILILCIALTGCATFLESIIDLNYLRAYEGNFKTRNDVSILTHINPYSWSVMFKEIDGKPTEMFAQFIELLPGQHTIGLLCSQSSAGYKTIATHYTKNVIQVPFLAEPGKIYIVDQQYNKRDQTFVPRIVEAKKFLTPSRSKALEKYVDDYFLRIRQGKITSIK